MCSVAYFQEAYVCWCVCVVCILYHHHHPPLLPATRLLGFIRDNYSTIDCHGGPITVFPVAVLRFELHHAGDPSNSTPPNFKAQQFPCFAFRFVPLEKTRSESQLDLCADDSFPFTRWQSIMILQNIKSSARTEKSLRDVSYTK